MMKKTDINAKSANTLSIEKKKDLIGIVNIFQLMDLVAEEQSYLEMLQTNGLRATEGKKEIGDERV
jgi:hypothetical protein